MGWGQSRLARLWSWPQILTQEKATGDRDTGRCVREALHRGDPLQWPLPNIWAGRSPNPDAAFQLAGGCQAMPTIPPNKIVMSPHPILITRCPNNYQLVYFA